MTCDTISGQYVTDIGENSDIGGGNNPDADGRSRSVTVPVPGHRDCDPGQRLSEAAAAAAALCHGPSSTGHGP